jgi:hypothetical protein
MYRLAATIVLSSVAFAQNAPEPDIVRAAKSPYDLARYINSHDEIDWVPLWKALGVDEGLGLPCSTNCTAELIVVDNPEQAILIVNAFLPFDVYLRFEKGKTGEWRVTGKYTANVWDGNPHRHEIVRAGSTQFLLVSTHGGHGSGLDEEMEDWLDLSRSSFEPVFSYAVRGHEDAMGAGISREIEADASANSSTEIELDLTVYLSFSTGGLGLGRFEFVGTYSRAPGGTFALQTVRSGDPPSAITKPDFEAFVRMGSASQEQEIKYALPRLKEIADGKNDEAKRWLRYVLDRAGDSPEKRTLLELLAKP